jgi:hypothetical protein
VLELLVILGVLVVMWKFRPRRRREPGAKYVYVNHDGSIREISPGEQEYLSTEFSGGDGGRPYIKSSYESTDGWGSRAGFIARRRVPKHLAIRPVHPNYDAREKASGFDEFGFYKASGDLIEKQDDGSILITPNPKISRRERFRLAQNCVLEEQKKREALAEVDTE